jgi:hypothetical protein
VHSGGEADPSEDEWLYITRPVQLCHHVMTQGDQVISRDSATTFIVVNDAGQATSGDIADGQHDRDSLGGLSQHCLVAEP